MEAIQPTDQGEHIEIFELLVAHPEEVARQLGGAASGLEALGAIIKADALSWPLSLCPPAQAARLYAAIGRALFGTDHDTTWLSRQVRQ